MPEDAFCVLFCGIVQKPMLVTRQQIQIPFKTLSKTFPLLVRIWTMRKKDLQFHLLCQPPKPRSLVLDWMAG